LLLGCGYNVPSPKERFVYAEKIAKNEFKPHIFHTKYYEVFSYEKNLTGCKKVFVYIEGDGLSWITPDLISTNPTPVNPVGLKMAINDIHECVVYLARPCQYVENGNCDYSVWTDARFSSKVIDSYEEILDELKNEYKIESFVLIGYSGGGAVATILDAYRNDISLLVTVAGNLNTAYWCKIHRLSMLSKSINPADLVYRLENKRQIHLIGGKDEVVGKRVFFSFYDKFKNKKFIKYYIYPNNTHTRFWDKAVRDLEKKNIVK
jgi:hypothetical protein